MKRIYIHEIEVILNISNCVKKEMNYHSVSVLITMSKLSIERIYILA